MLFLPRKARDPSVICHRVILDLIDRPKNSSKILKIQIKNTCMSFLNRFWYLKLSIEKNDLAQFRARNLELMCENETG